MYTLLHTSLLPVGYKEAPALSFDTHVSIPGDMTTVLSLYLFGLIVSLSLHTRATKVPDVSVVKHVEWLYPHPRAILVDPTCQKIRDSISNASAVYAPGTPEYNKDMGMSLSFLALPASCSCV